MEDRANKMVTTACSRCGDTIDITGLGPGDGIVCPYCSNEFLITRQFGNYLLEKPLGRGGMGTVYRARDVMLDRQVAVKVLHSELVSDEKFMATFLREAKITASLNHTNIVQVYAFGEHEEAYYMVVEYIQGGSLEDKIHEQGKITELEAIEIGIAVARGLECAFARDCLIHRDIKPGNILFDASNTPKVVDFGLSLSMDTIDHLQGEIWGTPNYVAPEKLEHQPETFSSDLYSLGATLFHAISGRPPYEDEVPVQVAMKHLSGELTSLKTLIPDISDETDHIIGKAMARYPKDRHESYAAFIAELENAKRCITNPNFRNAKKPDTVLIKDVSKSNAPLWSNVGTLAVVIVGILAGLIIWRETSSSKNDKASSPTTQAEPAKPVIISPIQPEPKGTDPTSTPVVAPVIPPAEVVSANLALNKPVTASSNAVHFIAAYAVDGDPKTRWASHADDDEWIYVDLGQPQPIDRVVLNWQHAYAKHFKIQLSDDALHWIDAAEITDGQGNIETVPISGKGRYVRMLGIERGTGFGYSLFEFEIYKTNHANP